MNIVCVICSDLLVPSDDVFHTPCGHIFHFVCLTQWLERSKSCPQCREKTTNHKIHRIYFNFSNNDTIIEDTCSLQDTIDKLKFQLLLKEKDVKHYTDKSETLTKQSKELMKEVRKLESELSEKNTAIYALKDQVKYFKEQNLEIQNNGREIEQLKKKLENYRYTNLT
ncbi:TRAF-interacting protein [Habropoda laboriosa]|uniref:TRAF-interacting protein n=1 Tax=Habropoda laboriosa TaxID=597456 RepID=A0A0L7REH9_9HYME|nr:TRAF-interacting protein [Habropoda laboriosa]